MNTKCTYYIDQVNTNCTIKDQVESLNQQFLIIFSMNVTGHNAHVQIKFIFIKELIRTELY